MLFIKDIWEIKKMQSLPLLQNNLAVRDIKQLLKLFRALRKTTLKKPFKKNRDLKEKAYKEAKEELNVELKKRQAGFTQRPGRTNIFPHKTSVTKQKIYKNNTIVPLKQRQRKCTAPRTKNVMKN